MARYEIVIKGDKISNKGGGAVARQENDTEQTPTIGNAKSAAFFTGAHVAYSKVKPWVNRVVSHEINLVELRSGSREAQSKAAFTHQIISGGVDVLESMASGLLLSGGNPLGALVGLGVGVVSKAIDLAQRQEVIDTQRSIENITIRQNIVRAGAKGSRSE
jgi:hypothetical protein